MDKHHYWDFYWAIYAFTLVMLQFVCIMLDTRYIHRAAAAVCFTEICSWKASCVLKMHKICKSANPFYVKCISINKENITLPKYIFWFSLVFISLLMAFLPWAYSHFWPWMKLRSLVTKTYRLHTFKHCGLKTSDLKQLKRNQQRQRNHLAICTLSECCQRGAHVKMLWQDWIYFCRFILKALNS